MSDQRSKLNSHNNVKAPSPTNFDKQKSESEEDDINDAYEEDFDEIEEDLPGDGSDGMDPAEEEAE